MATEALFNESYEELLKKARINTAQDEQTQELINMSVSEVRVGFFKALGSDRVITISSLDLVDNPSSDEEILRKDAANIEVLWLTYLLMQRLPHMSMAASSTVNQTWNQEPLTRDSNKDQIEALQEQVNQGLADLVESPDDYASTLIRASSVGPDEDELIGETFPGCIGGGW
tara:strand:+ start:2961 stop:3476 length:516 start_codon:yes stop_codon:yes gene_type:complete